MNVPEGEVLIRNLPSDPFAKKDIEARRAADGWCRGPYTSTPVPGAVKLDKKAMCPTCKRRVKVTVRGLFAHHKTWVP